MMGKFGDYPDAWDETSKPTTPDPREPQGGLFNAGFGGNARLLRRFGNRRQCVPATPPQTREDEHREAIATFVLQRIREITTEIGKENMIPSTGATPSGGRKRTGFPYLGLEQLSKTPQSARIIACKVDKEGQFGARIILKLAFKGETYLWTLTIKNNPNVAALTEKFGNDENDWVDKSILIGVEQDEFSGNMWPRVSFPKKG